MYLSNSRQCSIIEHQFKFTVMFNYWTFKCWLSLIWKTEHSKSQKDSYDTESSNKSSSGSILSSSDDQSTSSSDDKLQLIELQMRSLKKKIEKLRKKRKALTTKKLMRSLRKSQKTKSDISRLARKLSTKDNVSSIEWKSNSSIVEHLVMWTSDSIYLWNEFV